MMDIRGQILEQLNQIEREHHVRIPIAIESGSRAWGFASPDSDYDCRFIYVHPRDWYLSVFEGRDTIEYAPDAVFDVGGWDIRKVIRHLVKSNAVMLEWLSSGVVYRMNEAVRQELWNLGEAFFNPVSVGWHYLSMARNKLTEIEEAETSKIKKYCYVLRPLACIRHIHTHGKIPHMEYQRNLAEIALPDPVREEITRLLKEKETAAEAFPMPKNDTLLRYSRQESAWAEEWLGTLHKEKNRDYEHANRVFCRIIEMVNGYE